MLIFWRPTDIWLTLSRVLLARLWQSQFNFIKFRFTAELLLQQKVNQQKKICSSFSNVNICGDSLFYIIVNWISLSFGLLFWQNKAFEDVTCGSGSFLLLNWVVRFANWLLVALAREEMWKTNKQCRRLLVNMDVNNASFKIFTDVSQRREIFQHVC